MLFLLIAALSVAWAIAHTPATALECGPFTASTTGATYTAGTTSAAGATTTASNTSISNSNFEECKTSSENSQVITLDGKELAWSSS